MGRADLQYREVNCSGGINQSPEGARVDECLDARNVWAPQGKVVARPGYTGIYQYRTGGATPTQTLFYARTEDVSAGTFTSPTGAGVLTLSSLVGRVASGGDQDRWYLGFSSTFDRVAIVVAATNSNAVKFKAEYWNGTAWTYLHVVEVSTSGNHLGASTIDLAFVRPQDWATTTVDSQSAYWVRFNLLDADFDASTQIDVDNASTNRITDGVKVRGLFPVQFPSYKRYLTALAGSGTLEIIAYLNASNIAPTSLQSFLSSTNGSRENASIAVVPDFYEAFIAYNNEATLVVGEDAPVAATIENRDFAVGPGAFYSPSFVAQLSEFPRAKYIMFFGGRLWAAVFPDDPFAVRWGAPQPFHKVWPTLSIEHLSENDNSPITGLSSLGEYPVIFKRDSIWMAYDLGVNRFNLREYAIRKVVDGVGCTAISTVKEIRGNLVFMATDGLYSFNGATVKKVSLRGGIDRLADIWPTITPGRRPFAAAAHWRSEGTYLVSFTTDGSAENNLTIAWDYDGDTFWLWDNIDAQHRLEDEGANDEELLYFGDSQGRIYQFGVGLTDHGGTISSYVQTHRIGLEEGVKKRIRAVNIYASNKTREVDVTLTVNDVELSAQTVTFTDPYEKDWGTAAFNWGDTYTPLRRRRKRLDARRDPDWVQIKVAHDQKGQPFEMSRLEIGLMALGRR